jgi:hypothetical protein
LERRRISDNFMQHWFEGLPRRYGLIEELTMPIW